VIRTCLRKDPGQRFQHLGELARALEPHAPPWDAPRVARIAATIEAARQRRRESDLAQIDDQLTADDPEVLVTPASVDASTLDRLALPHGRAADWEVGEDTTTAGIDPSDTLTVPLTRSANAPAADVRRLARVALVALGVLGALATLVWLLERPAAEPTGTDLPSAPIDAGVLPGPNGGVAGPSQPAALSTSVPTLGPQEPSARDSAARHDRHRPVRPGQRPPSAPSSSARVNTEGLQGPLESTL
jgi:hypothetical protein